MAERNYKRYDRTQQQELLEQLMEGHQRFLSGDPQPKSYPFYDSLSLIHKKVATFLSCSDSRVSPELVFDQSFGDLFVVRSAGHTVDALTLGSLEFAVQQVNSPLLIVMGHEDCRAVHAATQQDKADTQNLQVILDAIRPALAGVKKDDLSAAVHAHVRNTVKILLERSKVLRHRVDYGDLMIAALYYHVSSGEIEVL